MRSKKQSLGNPLLSPKAMRELIDNFSAPHTVKIEKDENTIHKTIEERLAGFQGEYALEEWDTDLPVKGEVF